MKRKQQGFLDASPVIRTSSYGRRGHSVVAAETLATLALLAYFAVCAYAVVMF